MDDEESQGGKLQERRHRTTGYKKIPSPYKLAVVYVNSRRPQSACGPHQARVGRTTDGRDGFQRLVGEVTLNHVGMVLGLEMSRLARS